MTTASKMNDLWPDLAPETSDGRRHRSDRSRQQIIKAMFALLRDGDMSPSAGAIAERAGVGLRTVFRHFEDMDGIHIEMTQQVHAVIEPKLAAPLTSDGWKNQVLEMAERRADIYETVFPVKVSLSLRRFQSAFLQARYQSDLKLMRSSLKSILPAQVAADKQLFAALELTLGFSTWRRLRQDQNLSAKTATAVLMTMLNSLIESVDVA